MKKCLRCGGEFEPKPTRLKTIPMTRHCPDCMTRNFLDGIGLPTHPAMLDKHTKHPTLTNDEFMSKLSKGLIE